MPNKLSVEIYISRDNIEDILSDASVEQILVRGDIDTLSDTNCDWNIEAVGYPGMSVAGKPACPQPCPTEPKPKPKE